MENYEKAMRLALYRLGRRDHTKKQMHDYLRKKEVAEDTIEVVIEKLKGYGYLDDAAYAQRFAATRIRKSGRRKVAFELAQRGIDRDTAHETLGEIDEEEELQGAIAVAKKSLAGAKDPAKARQRAYAALARRGYGGDLALRALKEAMGTQDDTGASGGPLF